MTQPLTNGHTIRAIRRVRGIPQAQLAEQVGVSAGYLCHVEAGRRHPLPPVTARIAAELNVPAGALTGQISPITVLREIAGWTAPELARLVGITVADLDRIGRDPAAADPDVLAQVAARLGCDPAALTPVLGPPGGRVA